MSIKFREFENRDIDFVYHCKNDENLSRLIVGEFKPISKSEAIQWVEGCKGHHDDYIFWAICKDDESEDIIGWASLANINKVNKSASTHSIVIGDRDYNDGFTWIETVRFMFEYAFESLKLNRLYGVSLVGHPMSNIIGDLMFMAKEGVLRQAIFKNGRFYDLLYNAILRDEYYIHKENGDYEMRKIIKRLRNLRHG